MKYHNHRIETQDGKFDSEVDNVNVSGAYLKHNGLLHYADCKVKQTGYGKPPTPYGGKEE